MKSLVCILFFYIVIVGTPNYAAPPGYSPPPLDQELKFSDPAAAPLIPAWQLRRLAVHNAGCFSLPITCAGFPPYGNYVGSYRDAETGEPIGYGDFPTGTTNRYILSSGIWIGGIVNGDTLVSSAYDNWWNGIYEFWPPDPEAGGVYRSGNYADDEFVTIYTDTVTGPYVPYYNPFDDTSHIPMGIKVTQNSYSWQDTLYDNFVIIEFTLENISDNFMDSVWFGIIVDPDIYSVGGAYYANGWADDASGVLDTFLYDGDAASHVIIPYAIDMDGDPSMEGLWESFSVTAAVSIALLASPNPDPVCNFNWWIADDNAERDFGPRRVGDINDPFRPFAGGFLGSAHRQQDKYYLMSHPEIDYNQIELETHDSADGWIPSSRLFSEILHDTKFMYSCGPFEIASGDTAVVAIAVVASDGIHVDPNDYIQNFDPLFPDIFQQKLDFTELMINHRRADSVYRSGLQLPIPGPPVGLNVVDFSDKEITLAWSSSENPSLAGYCLNLKDTTYDDIWRRVHLDPITDTSFTFPVSNPSHLHYFSVSSVDKQGRESAFSFELPFIPATPHPPVDLSIELDGLVPVVNWIPYSDTSIFVYMIYRGEWRGEYQLIDSVSGLEYRDYTAESGVWYNYKIAAKNDLQLESEPAGPVSALPMALNKDVLFFDMNYDYAVHVDPYHRRYVDRLVHSIQPHVSMDYFDIEDGELSFKKMGDYSVIVFDAEMRGGQFHLPAMDSIRNYLHFGGKALFICPNASTRGLGMVPYTSIYDESSIFNEYLHLDSVVTNGIVLLDNSIHGDLMGCRSLVPEYPALSIDMAKLEPAPIPIEGYMPMSGFLYPDDSVEYLYRYQSSFPDSIFQEQVNGIKYVGENYSFILFNFPLSLMEAPNNVQAFRRALTDLGLDLTCGDLNNNQSLDVGDVFILVAYLFKGGPAPSDPDRADVNCDGLVNLGDAQLIINTIFLGGTGLDCCP